MELRRTSTRTKGRTENSNRITHLVPATPGWWVRFEPGLGEDDSWVNPVACWVVTEDEDGTQRVVGMNPSDDDDGALSGPIAQPAHYFYYPGFNTARASGTTDPGPRS